MIFELHFSYFLQKKQPSICIYAIFLVLLQKKITNTQRAYDYHPLCPQRFWQINNG